tara:strand:- start:2712 stop:4283 length:1572 start_codon:yes stop_codon:yes gene_type:complete
MGGGLMQLVAYGAQDIYLTGNPQITFFKVVYRRHTNFSMETIEQTINGSSKVGTGTGTVTISRNGDLVHKVYVNVSGSDTMTKGSGIVSEVELEIGGQRIDRHYEEWNNIWNELSTDESKAVGLKSMQCDIGTAGGTGVNLVQVPLNFWFCRNPGLALPLIALQYHEVKLKFTWGGGTSDSTSTCKVMCDYIYLDTDERRRFAQVSHEYLIEQIQRDSLSGTSSEKLNFNHPVKELIWLSEPTNAYKTAQLKLNGHDRFSTQEEEYFQLRQPFDYHTAVPKQNLPSAAQVSLLDRQTKLTPGTDGTTPTSPVFTAEAAAKADQNEALTNGQCRFQILNGRICFVGATTAPFDHDLFDTQNPVGTEFILNIDGSSKRILRDGGIGAAISTTFTGLGADATAFANAVAAAAINFVIEGTVIDLDDLSATENASSVAEKCSLFTPTNNSSNQARTSQMTEKINVYSFALKPEEHQPSGTCNFSRIDNAKLDFSTDAGTTPPTSNIYAVNYNVLRIMSGMGGLAYSN